MKRGDIWTLRDDRYASKARPVVVVQSDVADFDSVIVCLLTSVERPNSPARVGVALAATNGLAKPSYVMTDKLLTVKQSELGARVGALTDEQMHVISAGLAQILAIAKADLA